MEILLIILLVVIAFELYLVLRKLNEISKDTLFFKTERSIENYFKNKLFEAGEENP